MSLPMEATSSISPSYVPLSVHNPSPDRCTQCHNVAQQKDTKTRNLIVCIDGTSNKFGQNNTNVVKLFSQINLGSSDIEQYAYYSSGIGTRPSAVTSPFDRIGRAITEKFEMAVAWNIEEIVKDAYGWLARMYKEGDQIYLFGFSRGAYQVRVLAGMINKVGLIRTPTEKQIGTAYDHYKAIQPKTPETGKIASEFKDVFSWKDLRIHFVGVWDTVSSVGLRREDTFLSTSSSAAHACHFRHALALDEHRVKFIPEYFHEMNSQMECDRSRCIIIPEERDADFKKKKRRASTMNINGIGVLEAKKQRTTEIKEVWFAGSHSDVGGRNKPGTSHQAGNVSLLWMRREAEANGLVLLPTDIVWVPDDLNFGITDSMSDVWPLFEYLPIRHQISFSGIGEYHRRFHMKKPRRIIPGQKVHASILYANAYKPRASLGRGFDVPIANALLGIKPDDQFWETGMFDNSAAEELIAYLGSQQGVAPIYLDRLLFMLRFEEGKQCVRNVLNWKDQLMLLIRAETYAPLVRLVALVAFCEASCGPDDPESPVQLPIDLSQKGFGIVKEYLQTILATPKHRDSSRVVALLRPLTNHQILRQKLLTEKLLGAFLDTLDEIIKQKGEVFVQAMDGLSCLLQYDQWKQMIVDKLSLRDVYAFSQVSRLGKILAVKDKRLLTAALRMVLALSRIPAAKATCSFVKRDIRNLARAHVGLVGFLAAEIILALYDPADTVKMDIKNTNVRANLATALSCFDPQKISAPGSAQANLRRIFGLDNKDINQLQRKLFGELIRTVHRGYSRERIAATMTLLKLCEIEIIRTHLLSINILDVFIKQLRYRSTALLAAYALTDCLKYSDMKNVLGTNENLPKNIVDMLRRDYFDDAIGSQEGFQIFGNFMKQAGLREKINDLGVREVLHAKLKKGKPKETRTSLVCLNILRSYDETGDLTNDLIVDCLKSLRNVEWRTQKAAVIILSALVQTDHGVEAISPRVPEIIEMLLPPGYSPIHTVRPKEASTSITSSPPVQPNPIPINVESADPENESSGPSFWMMGPACTLHTFAQKEKLRDLIREAVQYGSLKDLHLSGALVNAKDTGSWRVFTPNRTDVIDILDKLIKAVDEEDDAGDVTLPHIQHWDRFLSMLGERALLVALAPVGLGLSAVTVALYVAFLPIAIPVVFISELIDGMPFMRGRLPRG